MLLHQARRSLLTSQEKKLFKQLRREPDDIRLLVTVLYVTGCRVSEALSLRPDCIDTDEGLIVFHTLKQRGAQRIRAVPVPQPFAHELADLTPYPTHRLWPFSRWTARRRVKAILLQIGVAPALANTKIFRHSYNDRGKQAGTPDHVRRALLGHRTQSANDEYGLLLGDELLTHARHCWGVFQ